MTTSQLSTLKANIQAAEGRTSWLYLDTRGYATCGVGHRVGLLSDAHRINFEPDITTKEWVKLMSATRGLRADAYQNYTTGRISEESIDALLDADIAACQAAMRPHFLGFDGYPDPAHAALTDMAYNLGTGGLMKFTHLVAAANAGNWATCAAQCHRFGISDERNAETARLFLQAAGVAEAVSAGSKGDVEWNGTQRLQV